LKILLTGKSGQVGSELALRLPTLGEVVALDRGEMDLSNAEQVRAAVQRIKPDVIVNPAAYTAVDKAESEPELAMRVNADAPRIMAQEAQRLGALMIHYSTDYVFDGDKEGYYTEEDQPNPRSVYGASKLQGERAVAEECSAYWIFRTSWVYGAHGGNFLKTILRLAKERENLKVVADQTGAPTWARSIAEATVAALRFRLEAENVLPPPAGIYHLCAGGATTWHGYASHVVSLAAKYEEQLKLKPQAIDAIKTEAYPLPAPRPKNSRLDTKKIQDAFGIKLPEWQGGVEACIAEIYAR
jgi:dTDP-4-dehydrorhamnose reductase